MEEVVKRIRRAADRIARQMRADMDEPSARPWDPAFRWELVPVFWDCDKCPSDARLCAEFCVGYLADDCCDAVIDERCVCRSGVQVYASTPDAVGLSEIVLNEIADELPDCEICHPGACECTTGIQDCTADGHWGGDLGEFAPCDVDDDRS